MPSRTFFPHLLVALALLLAAACESADTAADAGGGSGADAAASADGAASADAPAGEPDLAAEGCEAAAAGWDELLRLSPAEVHALLETEPRPLLLNVHTPYAGALPGTDAHIVFTDVDALEAALGHDPCADVVLYCLSDGMSVAAGEALVGRGYRRVRDLVGGMMAWEDAGYELSRAEPGPEGGE